MQVEKIQIKKKSMKYYFYKVISFEFSSTLFIEFQKLKYKTIFIPTFHHQSYVTIGFLWWKLLLVVLILLLHI